MVNFCADFGKNFYDNQDADKTVLDTDDKSLSLLSKPNVAEALLINLRFLMNLNIECHDFIHVSCCSLLSHFLSNRDQIVALSSGTKCVSLSQTP